jgi:hypothetical protein
MYDVVERILNTYQSMCPLDAERSRIHGKELADILKASRLLASATTSS